MGHQAQSLTSSFVVRSLPLSVIRAGSGGGQPLFWQHFVVERRLALLQSGSRTASPQRLSRKQPDIYGSRLHK